MSDLDFIGQVLDGKYQMARELGRGGMGTVYLATHLGTERPVAVKIISPQFMQRVEFVERFRREARAAGRLRHPNVVDVTDFGFSDTPDGQVAYLVMEYLDGCTLGEILEEEKNLPVGWTIDILEQVCSAVHEAHQQGIIHRDLKPDNIWLEPNQRGGYTVKVLDFGIAKLEEHEAAGVVGEEAVYHGASPTHVVGRATLASLAHEATQVSDAATIAPTAEQRTLVSAEPPSESATALYDSGDVASEDQETIGTQLISAAGDNGDVKTPSRSLYDSSSSAELTRVGAVLGTPLYMSPEQCRGEHLDPRSDVYSLGVIAYQMLSGAPPFSGDYKHVMEAHKDTEPPRLEAKKVRRKLKRAIHNALAKDPQSRPQTAEAFASELRSRSEGIFGLLRRAMVIYSEHLLKFLGLTAFFSIPMIVLMLILLGLSFLKVSEIVAEPAATLLMGTFGFALSLASAFCTCLIGATIAWIVAQWLAVPLRPVRLRPALKEAKLKWKRIAGAGILTAILPFVVCIVAAIAGFAVFATLPGMLYPVTGSVGAIFVAGVIGAVLLGTLGFFAAYLSWMLVPPVIMMENVGVWAALKRSRYLVGRSLATAFGAVLIMFLLPALIAGTISFVVNITAKALDPKPPAAEAAVQQETAGTAPAEEPAAAEAEDGPKWNWSLSGKKMRAREMTMQDKVKHTFLESLIQIFWLPMQIFVFSFSGIIVALLYLKTRLAGGESMNDLIERFEDDGRPRKKWQERVRQRLIQSGRIPSNP
jgi:serine/threonine protein kinase